MSLLVEHAASFLEAHVEARETLYSSALSDHCNRVMHVSVREGLRTPDTPTGIECFAVVSGR